MKSFHCRYNNVESERMKNQVDAVKAATICTFPDPYNMNKNANHVRHVSGVKAVNAIKRTGQRTNGPICEANKHAFA